jgi:hypothetical protein
MTDRRGWQIAFLKQARIEWEAYQRARQSRWPDCLQYAFPLIMSLQTSQGVRLLKDIENCIAEFEKLFLS